MNDQSTHDHEKKASAISAVTLVRDGMIVGIGTGSTAAYAISELGRLVSGGLDIMGIPTSYQSEMLAIEHNIPITTLLEHPEIDITLDGADQIDQNLVAIKGGGAAHTREKVVASAASRVVLMVDSRKIASRLNHAVPIEVLPYSRTLVERQVRALGGVPNLRMAARKVGPVITDNGNFIIDADFGVIDDPERLNREINAVVGAVEHGIFLNVDEVHVGTADGARVLKR
ncbi:MAG: ribose-5-phosphate isomerase RpiA [Methanosarcinales archaeon]|nr:ribose-5-phosphate isomerase RpiA [Methanosarcinales archaeon]